MQCSGPHSSALTSRLSLARPARLPGLVAATPLGLPRRPLSLAPFTPDLTRPSPRTSRASPRTSRALHPGPRAPSPRTSCALHSGPHALFTPDLKRPSPRTSSALHPGPQAPFTPDLVRSSLRTSILSMIFPRRMSMRKSLLFAGVSLAAAGVLVVSPAAQSPASSGYQVPPKVIADLMDAWSRCRPCPCRPLDGVAPGASPCHADTGEVAAPFLGLAGARVNPRTNGPRVLGGTTGLTLRDAATGTDSKLTLPTTRIRLAATFSPMASTSASRTPPTLAFACWSPTSRPRRSACCWTAASTDSAAAARGKTTPPASSAASSPTGVEPHQLSPRFRADPTSRQNLGRPGFRGGRIRICSRTATRNGSTTTTTRASRRGWRSTARRRRSVSPPSTPA